MAIQDWGAIGNIVAAIGVIASLLYLAIQIRQNNAYIRRQAMFDTLAAVRETEGSIYSDPELSRIFSDRLVPGALGKLLEEFLRQGVRFVCGRRIARARTTRFATLGLLDGVAISIVHTESENEIPIVSFRRGLQPVDASG